MEGVSSGSNAWRSGPDAAATKGLFQGGTAGGSVALAIVCVAALQGAARVPHANDSHSFS